jgi:hypothetical protein
MQSVEHFIGIQAWHLDFMIERIHTANGMLFEQDRAAWKEAYTNIDSEVVLLMQEWSELMGEGPGDDDDGNSLPGSPRWQAFDDLVKAKAAIPKLGPRQAACEAKPAKRTRKPKPVEV